MTSLSLMPSSRAAASVPWKRTPNTLRDGAEWIWPNLRRISWSRPVNSPRNKGRGQPGEDRGAGDSCGDCHRCCHRIYHHFTSRGLHHRVQVSVLSAVPRRRVLRTELLVAAAGKEPAVLWGQPSLPHGPCWVGTKTNQHRHEPQGEPRGVQASHQIQQSVFVMRSFHFSTSQL